MFQVLSLELKHGMASLLSQLAADPWQLAAQPVANLPKYRTMREALARDTSAYARSSGRSAVRKLASSYGQSDAVSICNMSIWTFERLLTLV